MSVAATTQNSPASSPSSSTGQSSCSGSAAPSSLLQAVDQMVATMGAMMNSYVEYANETATSTMQEANANTTNAIANMNNMNSEMTQASAEEQKGQKWGTVASIFGDLLGIVLIPLDPILGASMLGVSAAGQLHITQDIVNWISEGIQDIDPNLTSAEAQAIADVILVVCVVVVAVVLGVLTGGSADAAIADAAAEDVSAKIAEDVAKDIAEDVAEDVVDDVAEDVADDMAENTIEDAGANVAKDGAAPKTEGGSNRGKRARKFAMLLGSQAMMQTDLLPNIVKAVASASSNPDSKDWKYLEAAAFAFQLVLSIGLSIGGAMTTAPSSFDMKISETSQTSLRNNVKSAGMSIGLSESAADSLGKGTAKIAANATSYARNVALGAGLAEGASSAVAGAYSSETAYNEWEMSSQAENASLENLGTEIANTSNEMVQKSETKMEQELYEHNFASFADGAATLSEQLA